MSDARTLADLPVHVGQELLDGDPTSALQLFPPLADRDLEELTESVRKRGIRVPVELDAQARILDGHHRLQVARELGLEPAEIPVRVREDLEGEEDVLEYVLEVNLGRRHLTPEDRAQVAAELRGRGWSLRRIADRVGVGKSTIARDLSGSGVPDGTADAESEDAPERIRGRDGKSYPARSSRSSSTSTPSPASPEPAGGREPTSAEAGPPPGPAPADGDVAEPGPDRDPRLAALERAAAALQEAVNETGSGESELRLELRRLAGRCRTLASRIAGELAPERPSEAASAPTLRERGLEAWEEILEAVGNEAEDFVDVQVEGAARAALKKVGGWEALRPPVREGREGRLRQLRIRFVAAYAEVASGGGDAPPRELVL